MQKRNRRPSPALAISLIALFVALGGTGYAAVTINGKDIKNKSIAGKKLKNKTITGGKLRNGTITGNQISESALGKVPAAAAADKATTATTADRATVSNTTDQLRSAAGSLTAGQDRTILTHGPLSVVARCADTDANSELELRFLIASTTAGSWFASWADGSNDLGPTTVEDERYLNESYWTEDGPDVGIDYDNPADPAVSAVSASGAGFNAWPGGTVDGDTGTCRYLMTAQVVG